MEENKTKKQVDENAPLPEEKFSKSYESGRNLVGMMIFFMTILILASVGYFFRDPLSDFLEKVFSKVEIDSTQSVTIAYAEGLNSFDPTNYETRNRNFLGNIYEGLTRLDKNLSVDSSLALSWGRIDDYTWEFKLRESVIFHDGSDFDSEDVLASYDYASSSENSQIKSLFSTVTDLEAVDSHTIHVSTDVPDPLIPYKFAQFYIFSSETEDFQQQLIGTGPYYPLSYDTYSDGDIAQKLTLQAFDYYWGYYPDYDEVNLVNVPDKEARRDALIHGDVDLVANVALDVVDELEEKGIDIIAWPSLEVSFLLFSTDGVFAEKDLREAVAMSIDKQGFVDLLNGYADMSDQFVSVGVSGYDSDVAVIEYDPQTAEEIFEEYGVTEITVDITQGLEFLGAYIEEQLPIDVEVNYWDVASYQEGIENGDFDIYFMGYKTELGDALDMYSTLFASDGDYNGGYSNSQVDALIDEATVEPELSVRIDLLKQIMSMLLDDVAGIPLFESQVIYGANPDVEFTPRMDGYVFASQLR